MPIFTYTQYKKYVLVGGFNPVGPKVACQIGSLLRLSGKHENNKICVETNSHCIDQFTQGDIPPSRQVYDIQMKNRHIYI